MNEQQRADIAQQIINARTRQGMSQAALAKLAGVAPNTVGSMEAGENVRPGSLGKVLAALEIEPQSEADWRAGLPADVHLVVDVVARWLISIPESERPEAVFRLLKHIGSPARHS